MESAIVLALAAIIYVGLAAVFGYWGQKGLGVITLVFLASVAILLSGGSAWLGYTLGSITGAWIGLIVGILLAGLVWLVGLRPLTRAKKSGRFAANAWYSFAALSILGYLLAGSWIGLLTITLPVYLLFWGGLYFVAHQILPLRNPHDKSERRKAFRALITFSMGTNYPYYFVDEFSQPEKRGNGNSFLTFFAGPGFVYTPCDHVAYVSKGIAVSGVFEPGLTFTGPYDLEPRILDLRPQLRAFPVEALTKDGIPIKVTTFVPSRIDPGSETPQLGESFPFRKKAVYSLLNHELVERTQDKKQSGKKHEWVGGPADGLIPLIARPIVQDIVSRYTIDDLCAAHDPIKDPRVEIATEMRDRVREALKPLGLYLLGGGISNLEPQNENIKERRLANWRTRWEGEILDQMSGAQADRMYRTERARAEVESEIVKLFRNVNRGTQKLDLALALRFIDTLGDIFAAGSQWPLPSDELDKRLRHLRGESIEPARKHREQWLLED
jgi:regulator of protease activity HflC (stomatin/prohibitin superfamily)